MDINIYFSERIKIGYSSMVLSYVSLRNIPEDKMENYPWSLPVVQGLSRITFSKNIAFLVGENGSGKSTLLEAIAAASRVPIAGSFRIEEDESLAGALELGNYLTLKYLNKSSHGLFARAEDFIGFARKVKQDIRDLNTELEEVKAGWTGGDLSLATGAIEGEKNALINRYSADLEAMSHGEGFLKFFKTRITGRGLYLIDEPEAALSPSRQLALIALIIQKVKDTDSQFIIATHSPIMMAMPDSEIFYIQEDQIESVGYKETDHFKLTKAFLDAPEVFMSELTSKEDS